MSDARINSALFALTGVDPTDPDAAQLAALTIPAPSTVEGGLFVCEDFLGIGATLADTPSVTVTQTGTALTAAAISATAGAPVAGFGGWIGGKTDDVDAEIDLVALGKKPWLVPNAAGVSSIWCEIGLVIPTALTARQYFFGFSDAELESTATNGPLNIQTGLTVVDVATDAAGFIFSSLATAPTVWKYANTANGTQMTNAVTAGLTATVDYYTKLRVVIGSDLTARFWGGVGGAADNRFTTKMNLIGSVASAVTTGIPLMPVFSAAPTTTTGVEWEIDYIAGGVIVV